MSLGYSSAGYDEQYLGKTGRHHGYENESYVPSKSSIVLTLHLGAPILSLFARKLSILKTDHEAPSKGVVRVRPSANAVEKESEEVPYIQVMTKKCGKK